MVLVNILWPTFALVALIFVIWLVLLLARVRHLKANPPTRETFATGNSALAYFEPVELPANNLRNLFEMPVLYFALVPLLMMSGQETAAQIVLAWAFVLVRVAHSVAHLAGRVQPRAMLFLVSTVILLTMWIGFFVDSVSAAQAYNEAAALDAIEAPL